MRRLLFCVLALFLVSTALPSFSQQTDIRQFVVFGSYTYLSTPSLNLVQRGFDGDLGYNYRSWLSLGFDFGYYTGHSALQTFYLNPGFLANIPVALQRELPLLAPAGVPYNITTQTYEAGPQFNYRKLKKLTFFVRPALGALHSNVKVSRAFLAQLPGGAGAVLCTAVPCSPNDTVPFYGFGAGISWEITPHFGLRATTDFAHYDFFASLLNGGRNSVRVSIGPKFSFGKNILEK